METRSRKCVVAFLAMLSACTAHAASVPSSGAALYWDEASNTAKIEAAHGAFHVGDEVTLITIPGFSRYCCAKITALKAKQDSPVHFFPSDVRSTAYALDWVPNSMKKAFGIAIKGNVKSGKRPDVRAMFVDLDGDNTPEVLRYCVSSEGLHVTAWQANTERKLWHLYFYLGQDLEPNCTDKETVRGFGKSTRHMAIALHHDPR